jgi:N-acetylmuramoyl-L-alanine amidase
MQPSSTLRRLALAAVVTGAAVTATPALANAASTCTFSPNSVPARVDVFDGSGTFQLAIERSGSSIVIFDVTGPMIPCTGPTGKATVFNTDQIVVHGNATSTFDHFSTHTMGPGKTPESDGNSELEVLIFEDTPTNLAVFGTAGPDTMRVASGGGVMLGSDNDVDVRARSATHVSLQGGFGSDYLSGRGGFPSSIPGPATTKVTMFGEEGDNILIDGPLAGDHLQGGDGNDTLFTHDLQPSDHSFGLGGFDQLTKDPGDTAGSDVDKINVVGVGRLKLAPAAVTAHAGKPARVELAWKHPKAWKQLRSLKLRASDAGEVVSTITIDPGRGRISDRGAITATSRSKVAHRGKTVTAHLELRPAKKLAGRTLHLAVQATDARGRTQVEPLAGRLTVAR